MNDVVDLVRFSRTRADLERFALKNPSYDPLELLERIERKNAVKHSKTCAFVLCQEPFIAERKDTIYCSDAHKVAAYRLRKQGYESTELSDALLHAHEAELQWHGVAGTSPDALKAKRTRDAALRAAYDAIGAELALQIIARDYEQGVSLSPANDATDKLQNEPENDAEQDDLTPENVQEKLREYRAKVGSSQNEVAEKLGCSQGHVNQFERGRTNGSPEFRRKVLELVR